MDYAIGIDIGGTKIAGGLVDQEGRVFHEITAPTPAQEGSAAILETAFEVAQRVRAAAAESGAQVSACGVGAAGQIEFPRGRVRYASPTLKGWAGTEIAQTLSGRLGLPVAVDNDANVLALAEQRFGAGRGLRDVLFVTVGTGIGGALVLDGRLRRGSTSTAGEIGTLLVEVSAARMGAGPLAGKLESYASGPAIAARYCEMMCLDDAVDLRTVTVRAQAGDVHARAALREGAVLLGLALNGLLNTLDPQAVIVGGGVAQIGELWWTPLLETIRANPMPGPAGVLLLPAELATHAPIAGAGALAFEAAVT
ncbi:MAG: ROK family protein [Chloroflexi bacterium]|nr:ROK family protein [Chloroflexota bacterium]